VTGSVRAERRKLFCAGEREGGKKKTIVCGGCLRDECTHHHRLHRDDLVFFKSRHPGGEILKAIF